MIFMMPYYSALEKLGLLGDFTSRKEKEFLNERGRYLYACDEAPVSAAVQMFKIIISKKIKTSPARARITAEAGVVLINQWSANREIRDEEGDSAVSFVTSLI